MGRESEGSAIAFDEDHFAENPPASAAESEDEDESTFVTVAADTPSFVEVSSPADVKLQEEAEAAEEAEEEEELYDKEKQEMDRIVQEMRGNAKEEEWAISFEQFLANIANEETLLTFFEQSTNLSEELKKLRNHVDAGGSS